MASTDFGDTTQDFYSISSKSFSEIPFIFDLENTYVFLSKKVSDLLGLRGHPKGTDFKQKFFSFLISKLSLNISISFLVENITTREIEPGYDTQDWRFRVDPRSQVIDEITFDHDSIVLDTTRKWNRLIIRRISLQRSQNRPLPDEGLVQGPVRFAYSSSVDSIGRVQSDEFAFLLGLIQRRRYLLDRLTEWEKYLNDYTQIVENKRAWIEYQELRRETNTEASILIFPKSSSSNAPHNFFEEDDVNLVSLKPTGGNLNLDEQKGEPLYIGELAKGQNFRKKFERALKGTDNRPIRVTIFLQDDYVILDESDYSPDPLLKLPEEGSLLNSIFLDRLPIDLQKKAIDRLREGQAANPRLEDFFFDISEARPPIREETVESETLIQTELNSSQYHALNKALNAPDIALIQGPPGTGKTTLISELCHQVVLRGGKVLIASQTNLAVDNALTRLSNLKIIRPIRLGANVTEEGADFIESNVVRRWFRGIGNEVERIVKSRYSLIESVQTGESFLETLHQFQNEKNNANAQIEEKRKHLMLLNISIQNVQSKLVETESEIITQNDLLRFYNSILESNNNFSADLLTSMSERFPNFLKYELDYFENCLQDFLGIASQSVKALGLSRVGLVANALLSIQSDLNETISDFGHLREMIGDLSLVSTDELSILENRQHSLLTKMKVSKDPKMVSHLAEELVKVNNEIDQLKENIQSSTLNTKWKRIVLRRQALVGLFEKIFTYFNAEIPLELEQLRSALSPKAKYESIIGKINALLQILLKKPFLIPIEVLTEAKTTYSSLTRNVQTLRNHQKDLLKEQDTLKKEISQLTKSVTQVKKVITNKQKSLLKDVKDFFTQQTSQEISFGFAEVSEELVQFLSQFVDEIRNQNHLELLNAKRWYKIQQEWLQKIETSIAKEFDSLVDTYIDYANVVGATCSETGKYRFWGNENRIFDLVIIDEVSKATPPELLMPMLLGKQIILVGDHRQLPPTFKISRDELPIAEIDTEEADRLIERYEQLVTTSYFQEMFEEAHLSLKESLTIQYRMHPSIMKAINQFYPDNPLSCGITNPEVARKNYFVIRAMNQILTNHECNITWVDTSNKLVRGEIRENLEKRESGRFRSRYNLFEVQVIERILLQLNKQVFEEAEGGGNLQEVGIITFYAGQLRKIRDMVDRLRSGKRINHLNTRIGTVDRFQGMERPIIIVSLVSSPGTGNPTPFVREFRRLNVAFSRAQKLLVIVGSKQTFHNVRVRIRRDNGSYVVSRAYANIISECEFGDGGGGVLSGVDFAYEEV